MKRNFIPGKLYKRIQGMLPVVCVDVLIRTNKGLLLGVRRRPPALGLKWAIGGRVLYGERLDEAVMRKAKEEAGLDVRIVKRVGVYTVISTKGSGEKRHSVAVVYLARSVGGRLKLNYEYSGFVFAKKPDKSLHPYMRTIIQDSGVFGKVKRMPMKRRDYFVL